MAKSSTASSIDDLTYDVITVLQNKAKALEAYDTYLRDAEAEDDEELVQLFAEMRKQDEEHVMVLKEALARRLDEDLGYIDEEEEDEDEDVDDDIEYDRADEVLHSADDDSSVNRADDSVIENPREPTPRRGESTHRPR